MPLLARTVAITITGEVLECGLNIYSFYNGGCRIMGKGGLFFLVYLISHLSYFGSNFFFIFFLSCFFFLFTRTPVFGTVYKSRQIPFFDPSLFQPIFFFNSNFFDLSFLSFFNSGPQSFQLRNTITRKFNGRTTTTSQNTRSPVCR